MISRFILTLIGLSAIVPFSRAQGTVAEKTQDRSAGQVATQRLGESRKAAKAGNLDLAENKILADMINEPGTASWHIEAASRLLEVAFLSQESNDLPTAQKLAKRALKQLDKSESQFSLSEELKAQILTLRGVIAERLTGNSEEAEKTYRKALKHDEDSGASERLNSNKSSSK